MSSSFTIWGMKQLLMAVAAFGFGMVASAGVFTVFATVELVPRYVGKTHSAKKTIIYENWIIAGTMVGAVTQLFTGGWKLPKLLFGAVTPVWYRGLAVFLLCIMGIFYGIFVGTLALSIAEMLSAIPVFGRRIRMTDAIPKLILAIAFGKLCGALLYFTYGFYE